MKKITAVISAIAMAFLMAVNISAEYAADENILADYTKLTWDGDEMYFQSGQSPVMFFGGKSAEMKAYEAVYTVDLTDRNPGGFYFSIELGNNYILDAANGDTVSAKIKFSDENGGTLLLSDTGDITVNKEYHGYSLGTADAYYAVPDGAAKCEVILSASYNSGNTFDAFFRNLNLTFSRDKAVDPTSYSNFLPSMTDSGALAGVQQDSMLASQIMWTVIVFAVALIMYFFARKKKKIAHENANPIEKKRAGFFNKK